MTGWRIGYVVAHQSIIAEMEKLMEHMVSSVTAFVQKAALAAISAPQDFVQDMLREYEKRRMVTYQGLNAIDGISCTLPAGTFYAFPNISSFGMTSWDFAKYLLQEGKVATIPGSIFGRQGEGHLRLSFAATPRDWRKRCPESSRLPYHCVKLSWYPNHSGGVSE